MERDRTARAEGAEGGGGNWKETALNTMAASGAAVFFGGLLLGVVSGNFSLLQAGINFLDSGLEEIANEVAAANDALGKTTTAVGGILETGWDNLLGYLGEFDNDLTRWGAGIFATSAGLSGLDAFATQVGAYEA